MVTTPTTIPVPGEVGHEHGPADIHGARALIDDHRVARNELGDLQSHQSKEKKKSEKVSKEHAVVT